MTIKRSAVVGVTTARTEKYNVEPKVEQVMLYYLLLCPDYDAALMKAMLGNKKVRGTNEGDPNKFIKPPMKGIAAVTNVFAMKKSASRQNLRFKC